MTKQHQITAAIETVSIGMGIIALCFNISCNEKVVVYDTVPYTIVGHWDWIQSIGMFGLVTPKTEQRSMLFTFDGDSTFYRIIMYWGGETSAEQSTYRYELYSEDERRGTVYLYPSGYIGFVTFTGPDEMEIESEGVESDRSIFKRRTTGQ